MRVFRNVDARTTHFGDALFTSDRGVSRLEHNRQVRPEINSVVLPLVIKCE
jgi:hypothetical protein